MAYDEILIGNNFPEIQVRQPITCLATLSRKREEEEEEKEGRDVGGGRWYLEALSVGFDLKAPQVPAKARKGFLP